MTTILKGHVSPETAYLVSDYPYGFRLRCKIRYWLDVHPKLGVRLVSQTTNPKVSGEVWNKPKASTYRPLTACMFLDEENHVTWTALRIYGSADECDAWVAEYGEGCPESKVELMRTFVKRKRLQETAKADKEAA